MFVRHQLACVIVLLGALPPITVHAQARRITLSEALSSAQKFSSQIRLAEAEVASAMADIKAAGISAYNPEASFSIGPSTNADTTLTSYQVGISQTIELGGKRGLRKAGASKRLDAAQLRLEASRTAVNANVRRTFGLAVLAQTRLAALIEADSVVQSLKQAADERLRLGAGTQLELNVATAAAAIASRNRLVAERDVRTAVLQFDSTLGLAASDIVLPDGALPVTRAPSASEDEAVQRGLQRRLDLSALTAERQAAEIDLRLARALGWPDPTLGVSTGKAEDFKVLEFGVALPLPLWNRGQGARAQASAFLLRAQVTEATTLRNAELEIRDAYRGLITALEAQRVFDRDIVERLGENLSLAEESFRAGKIGLLVYNNVRRDLVEARLAYLDATAEVIERHAALEIVTGGILEDGE